jgi:thiol-disulfide isomerase/thioredoxin
MRSITALLALAIVGLVLATVLLLRQNGPDNSEPDVVVVEPEFDAPAGTAMERPRFEPVPVPDFELATLDGDTYRMSDRQGKVVIINFWATWCAPCRFEIPELIELQDDYAAEGFEVLGISTDDGGFDVVRPFAEEMKINYPIVVDPGQVSSAFGGIFGLPTTFIVDRNGVIRERILGLVTRQSLEPRLQILLSEQV